MDDHPQHPDRQEADGATVYEFEAECQGTIIETWRVTLPGLDELDDEELAERLDDALFAGDAEFVSQVTDDEHERDLKRESIVRL